MKKQIRKKILQKRKSLNKEYCKHAGSVICEKILNRVEYKNSNTIMSYISINNEVLTDVLNKKILNDKKNLLLPACLQSEENIMFIVKTSKIPDKTNVDRYGIPIPEDTKKRVEPESIDLIITPGVAFNESGYRIGYGKGYYDRFLKEVNKDCINIGIGYDFQIVNTFKPEPHDIPVDIVITEKSIYYNECK